MVEDEAGETIYHASRFTNVFMVSELYHPN